MFVNSTFLFIHFKMFEIFLSQHDSVGLQCFELSVGGCVGVCVGVCVSSFSKNVLCNISTISKPILVKFWIINLMTKPNKPYNTTPCLDLVSRDFTLVPWF